jgi:hypothetical protein
MVGHQVLGLTIWVQVLVSEPKTPQILEAGPKGHYKRHRLANRGVFLVWCKLPSVIPHGSSHPCENKKFGYFRAIFVRKVFT